MGPRRQRELASLSPHLFSERHCPPASPNPHPDPSPNPNPPLSRHSQGTISKREFRGALVTFGFSSARKEVDSLFDELDTDRGGLLDYRELAKVLRRGAGDEIEIAAELQAGAMGEIELEAKNRISLRQVARDETRLARTGLEVSVAAIREALEKDLVRVIDLMRALDVDEDGSITKQEFHKVLPLLGFDSAGTAALDELFDTIDADGGGSLAYEELHRLFRKAGSLT